MYADHLQYDRRRQLDNSRLRARKRNDRRPGAEHTHHRCLSRATQSRDENAQIDNGIIPRLGRPFMEKGVRSRYNGIVSLEYRPTDALHFYADFVGGRITNAFNRADINWIGRNGAVIPVNETVDANNRGHPAEHLPNRHGFWKRGPYHERNDYLSFNPGADGKSAMTCTLRCKPSQPQSLPARTCRRSGSDAVQRGKSNWRAAGRPLHGRRFCEFHNPGGFGRPDTFPP